MTAVVVVAGGVGWTAVAGGPSGGTPAAPAPAAAAPEPGRTAATAPTTAPVPDASLAPAPTPLAPAPSPLGTPAAGPFAAGTPDDGTAVLVPAGAVVAGAAAEVVRQQPVAVDVAALERATGTSATVDLPLVGGTVAVRLDAPRAAADGSVTWTGEVDGQGGSSVVLVGHEGALAGTVVPAHGPAYRITAVAAGEAVVEELDTAAFPEGGDDGIDPPSHPDPVVGAAADGPSLPDGTPATSTSATSTSATSTSATSASATVPAAEPDGVPVVDVLVGYTTAAMLARGGRTAIEADIRLAVGQANQAFVTSGIAAHLRLTRAVEVPTNGDVTAQVLAQATSPTDGWNDSLTTMRTADGADLVALVVDDSANAACGIAYIQNPVGSSFRSYAYSVVDQSCSTGNFSFAHELGHSLGAAHDRGSWSGTPAFGHGYDWVDPAHGWRTVMAYANACPGCTRLLRFSNPDLTVDGAPTGAPVGSPQAADNRAVLNSTAAGTAAFLQAPVPLAASTPAGGSLVGTGRRLPVTWNAATGLGSTVRLELVAADGTATPLAAGVAAAPGTWTGTVPTTVAAGTGYRVRVTSTTSPSVTATTATFRVVVCP